MRRFTAAEIIALNPCLSWPSGRVRAVVGRGVTGRQIAASQESDSDRLWLLVTLLFRGPFTVRRLDAHRRAVVLLHCGLAQDNALDLSEGDLRDAIELLISVIVAWLEGSATPRDVADARDLMWDNNDVVVDVPTDDVVAAADALAALAEAEADEYEYVTGIDAWHALASSLPLRQLAEILDGGD